MIKAKDLTQEAPRSSRTRLGGHIILGRMIDKGRATLAWAPPASITTPVRSTKSSSGFKDVQGDEVKRPPRFRNRRRKDCRVAGFARRGENPGRDRDLGLGS